MLRASPEEVASKADATAKADQEKERKEAALANATGIRVLQTIVAAFPVG